MAVHTIDLTEQRFGKLVAKKIVGKNSSGNYKWLCQCDCGNEKIVLQSNLRAGNTVSCGCHRKEILLHKTHGENHTDLYGVWHGMMLRCHTKSYRAYKWYGARGIIVCDHWHKYENFRDWANQNGYQKGLTIERINNNKGYSPDNCRWATTKEQQNNRRSNHLVTYNGETHNITQWGEITGLGFDTIARRLKNGWSIEDTLTKPKRIRKRKENKLDG